MDSKGLIYQLSGDELDALRDEQERHELSPEKVAELKEDVARLDGYLRGRAEADAPKRGKGANKDLAG